MMLLDLLVLLLTCWHATALSISDPRQEYHSAITSGERAFLKAAREVEQDTGTSTYNYRSTKIETLPRGLFQLANEHGFSTSRLDSRHVDPSEILRTQKKAEEGSSDAAYFMGLFHLYGLESLEPNVELAAEWFRQSADGGHNDARFAIGMLLYEGRGSVEIDKIAATNYFRLASNAGHSFAHYLYGRALFEAASSASSDENVDKQMEEAAALFRMVSSELPEASHLLAVIYEYGLVKSDNADNYATAAELYESASKRGHAEATYYLGLMHFYGRGFPKDYIKAAELFRLAATHPLTPNLPSMRYLAIIHSNGLDNPDGIPNFHAALNWYSECSSVGTRFRDLQRLCQEEREDLEMLVMKQNKEVPLAAK